MATIVVEDNTRVRFRDIGQFMNFEVSPFYSFGEKSEDRLMVNVEIEEAVTLLSGAAGIAIHPTNGSVSLYFSEIDFGGFTQVGLRNFSEWSVAASAIVYASTINYCGEIEKSKSFEVSIPMRMIRFHVKQYKELEALKCQNG